MLKFLIIVSYYDRHFEAHQTYQLKKNKPQSAWSKKLAVSLWSACNLPFWTVCVIENNILWELVELLQIILGVRTCEHKLDISAVNCGVRNQSLPPFVNSNVLCEYKDNDLQVTIATYFKVLSLTLLDMLVLIEILDTFFPECNANTCSVNLMSSSYNHIQNFFKNFTKNYLIWLI